MSPPKARASAFDLGGRVIVITGGCGPFGRRARGGDRGGRRRAGDRGSARRRGGQGRSRNQRTLRVEGGARSSWTVASRPACDAALARVLATHGRLDGLINNAALNPKVEGRAWPRRAFENYSLELWNRELSVGLTGAFLCAQVFVPTWPHTAAA